MKTHKKTLATTGLILMAVLFMMITISSPAQEIRDTADRVERQMADNPTGQELLPGGPIERDMGPHMDRVRLFEEKMSEKSPEKSPGVRFTVDSDALIHGTTIGRGGGAITENTALGFMTLFFNTAGWGNTASGAWALHQNTTGNHNTAIGAASLYSNLEGSGNTATGYQALFTNVTGWNNTANGFRALHDNDEGHDNTGIGAFALYSNTSGDQNTAVGIGALYSNTTGIANTAVGRWAMNLNTSGFANTAIGRHALKDNETGNANVAVGDGTLSYNTEGNGNTGLGTAALVQNLTGYDNTGVGNMALRENTTGYANTACGAKALYHNKANSRSTAIGYEAMFYADNNNRTDGRETYNTAVGYQALMGSLAAENNLGRYNTAIGDQALRDNSAGSYNTAIGHKALGNNTSGWWNTSIGQLALENNTEGLSNTAIGVSALQNNTSGETNTAIGGLTLSNITSGDGNTAVGYYAGSPVYTINHSTFIGKSTRPMNEDLTNVTAIGYEAQVYNSNTVVIGNSSVKQVDSHAGWFQTSDGTYKSDIQEGVPGLDFILKLRPVTYNMDVHKLSGFLGEDIRRDEEGNKMIKEPCQRTLKSRDAKSAIVYSGFVAQEVEAVSRDMGYDFSGISAPENEKGLYSINYAAFTVPIVKAIQEQQALIELLEPQTIGALQEEVEELKAATVALETENLEQKSRLSDVEAENAELKTKLSALKVVQTTMQEDQAVMESRLLAVQQENEQLMERVSDILLMMEAFGNAIQDCCSEQTTNANIPPHDNNIPRLEQNNPNPFNEHTLIRYFLPEGTRNASIVVTDINGAQQKVFVLNNHGAGQIVLRGGALPSGTYIYSLRVNGQQVDSKRMVLL